MSQMTPTSENLSCENISLAPAAHFRLITPPRRPFVVTELSVVPVGPVMRDEEQQVPEAGVLLVTTCRLSTGGN